jgi:HEAT repeat protein
MNEQIAAIIKSWRSADLSGKKDLIKQIVKTGNADGLMLLSQIVNRDRDIEIRQSARKAYNSLYRYCYPSREEYISQQEAKSNPESEATVIEWLESRDPEQEMNALLHMQASPYPEAVEVLRKRYLEFSDDRVKATLVKTLGLLGEARDIPLCYAFLEDENPRIRANAIESLELINHPNTYMIFVQWLSDSDNRVKANCIKALRRLGRQSVNRILEEMLHSEYTAYKESALYVISLTPSRQGLKLLQDFLAQEYDPALVESAVHIIHAFSEAEVPGAADYIEEFYAGDEAYGAADDEATAFDPRDLHSADVETVLRCLSRILENQYLEMAPQVIQVLEKFKHDFRVSSYILRILGELCLSDYLSQVLPFLNSEDDRVRANAVEAVGKMGKPVDYLVPFLQDRNNRVRANSIVALAGGMDVTDAVLQMSQDENPLFRRSVLYAIKQIKQPGVLRALESLIHDTEVGVRNQALEILQFYEICGIEGSTEILQAQGQSLYE